MQYKTKLEQFTRTEETEKNYEKKVAGLIERYRNDLSIATNEIEFRQFVGWLICLKKDWSPNTWKQYKASVTYTIEKELSQLDPKNARYHKAKEALAYLSKQDQTGTTKRGNNTSSKKMKKCSDEDFAKMIAVLSYDTALLKQYKLTHIRISNSKWRVPLLHWLYAGILTGLRPIEWAESEIIKDNERVKLIVKNAKNSNGRTHGDKRTVEITALSDVEKEHIYKMVEIAQEYHQKGEYEELQKGCSNLLANTYSKMFPKRQEKLSLYSLRHQFSANAKMSGYSLEEIAALMGHAVDDTATVHYAKKQSGRFACTVLADPDEVNRIRKVFTSVNEAKQKVAMDLDNDREKTNQKQNII